MGVENIILDTEAYLHGVFLHEVFACLLVFPYIAYLYVLMRFRTFLQLNHRIFLIMPLTFLLLGIALVSGIFLLAMRGFVYDTKIILMLLVFGILLFGEIYRLKILRKAKISRQAMQRYVRKCLMMYLTFFFLHIALIAWCKIFP
ncbi:hypothetical protein CQA66_07060 [Helicobacter aurati]|uniref:Uncharacterized protein n=1 Tax=Helicobacter aurati TaxID=137778 RepID=A0A3D8J0M9_9HELI|nr:hypothetical protein [Helicobacter aurati]RDU71048.1 hypothetical protein CQA66_07060 [Helicobacter aurati]